MRCQRKFTRMANWSGMTQTPSTRTLVLSHSSKAYSTAMAQMNKITQSGSILRTIFHPGSSSAYNSKLLKQLEELSLDQVDPLTKSPTSLTSTPLSTLSLKLNKPYWFLHQGNCEHFLVFDQIRLGLSSSSAFRDRSLIQSPGCFTQRIPRKVTR